jgi:hypothetical protein
MALRTSSWDQGIEAERLSHGGKLPEPWQGRALLPGVDGLFARRAVLAISLREPFPTIEAGLFLIDLMLVALFVVTAWVWIRLGRRIRGLRNQ